MPQRRDPITDELHMSRKDWEVIRRVAYGEPVQNDSQAEKMFAKVRRTAGQIGAQVLVAVVTHLIEQYFPHLLPAWRKFVEFLDNPHRGLR